MSEIHFAAYREDGSPVMGNLDGQAILRVRNYRRTNHYKWVRDMLRNGRFVRIDHVKVHQGYYGPVLEEITR